MAGQKKLPKQGCAPDKRLSCKPGFANPSKPRNVTWKPVDIPWKHLKKTVVRKNRLSNQIKIGSWRPKAWISHFSGYGCAGHIYIYICVYIYIYVIWYDMIWYDMIWYDMICFNMHVLCMYVCVCVLHYDIYVYIYILIYIIYIYMLSNISCNYSIALIAWHHITWYSQIQSNIQSNLRYVVHHHYVYYTYSHIISFVFHII